MKATVITINGKVYEDEKGLVASLINAGLLTEVKPSKAEEKSESKKDEKTEKAEKKDEDWFNEAEYKRLSEKFDVRTQDGSKVLKWARPVLYKVMRGELAENKCKAEITKARKANEKKYGKKTA